MINLDVGTVGFSVAIVSLALCFAIPRGNNEDSKQRLRFQLFVITTACYGLGLLAILYRGPLPFQWSILGGNLLVMISAIAVHAGISVIVRRPLLPKLYIVLLVCYIVGMTYYVNFDDSMNARIAVISLVRVPLFVHAAMMLHQARRKEAFLGLAIMEIVVIVWFFLLIHRSFNAVFDIDPDAIFVSLTGFQAIYLAAAGLGKVLLVTALYRIDADRMSQGLALSNAELSNANQILIEEITQRRNAEIQLQISKEVAEAANTSKSRFLAAASHDLRQPMQAIGLFADALLRTELSAEQKNIGQFLSQSTQSLGDLLSVLLDISKLDAGAVKSSPEIIPVEALMRKIDAEYSSMTTNKSLRFILCFPFRDMAIITDGKLLMSLLGNLIGNAIKYTSQGGVLLAFRRRGNQALIQVWDTGIGISAEHVDNIFEEYFQVGNPGRDSTKGLGLGLAIARRIAKLLETEVVCRSQPGKGSVFEFRLPLADSVVKQKKNPIERPVLDADAASQITNRRVVVVEDDLMVATATQVSLESYGMSVTRYANAEDALADSEIANADFYISDFRLPGLNGVEFLDAIQQRSTKPIKGVVLTGDMSIERIGTTHSSSWPVFFKPIDLLSLLSVIESEKLM